VLNEVSFIGNVILTVEDSSLVGNSVEDLFNHDSLENDNEDVKGWEQVSCLGHEFPFSSIVNAFNMVSIFNGNYSVCADDDLSNTEDGVINDEDLCLFFKDC